VQAGEGEVRLGVDPDAPQNRAAVGLTIDVVEERGLADARFAADDEDTASTGPRVGEEIVECRRLVAAADEHQPTAASSSPTPWRINSARELIASFMKTLRR
jgi:hypothetical protein